MEYRVEALAAAANVSVDTIRFYQGRGLLDLPRRSGRVALYGDEHLERLRRVKSLQERGFNLGVIARIVRGEIDPADQALVEAVVAGSENGDGPAEEFWTLAELGSGPGCRPPCSTPSNERGVLVPRHQQGRARYTEADLVALHAGLKLLEFGLPLTEVLDLARMHTEGARLVAERAVSLFDRHIRQARRHDDQSPAELVEAFHALLPATVSLVAHQFRRILLSVAQEHIEAVGDDQELAAVRSESLRRIEPPVVIDR